MLTRQSRIRSSGKSNVAVNGCRSNKGMLPILKPGMVSEPGHDHPLVRFVPVWIVS